MTHDNDRIHIERPPEIPSENAVNRPLVYEIHAKRSFEKWWLLKVAAMRERWMKEHWPTHPDIDLISETEVLDSIFGVPVLAARELARLGWNDAVDMLMDWDETRAGSVNMAAYRAIHDKEQGLDDIYGEPARKWRREHGIT